MMCLMCLNESEKHVTTDLQRKRLTLDITFYIRTVLVHRWSEREIRCIQEVFDRNRCPQRTGARRQRQRCLRREHLLRPIAWGIQGKLPRHQTTYQLRIEPKTYASRTDCEAHYCNFSWLERNLHHPNQVSGILRILLVCTRLSIW